MQIKANLLPGSSPQIVAANVVRLLRAGHNPQEAKQVAYRVAGYLSPEDAQHNSSPTERVDSPKPKSPAPPSSVSPQKPTPSV